MLFWLTTTVNIMIPIEYQVFWSYKEILCCYEEVVRATLVLVVLNDDPYLGYVSALHSLLLLHVHERFFIWLFRVLKSLLSVLDLKSLKLKLICWLLLETILEERTRLSSISCCFSTMFILWQSWVSCLSFEIILSTLFMLK